MTDLEKDLVQAVKTGLAKAIQDKMTGYNSPLDKLLTGIIENHGGEIKSILVGAISKALTDEEFRQQITVAVRSKLAKTLIDKFGGELERQVNALKSDPATRARITLAIEEIVQGHKA